MASVLLFLVCFAVFTVVFVATAKKVVENRKRRNLWRLLRASGEEYRRRKVEARARRQATIAQARREDGFVKDSISARRRSSAHGVDSQQTFHLDLGIGG